MWCSPRVASYGAPFRASSVFCCLSCCLCYRHVGHLRPSAPFISVLAVCACLQRLLQEPSYGAPSGASDRALPHALAVRGLAHSVGAPSATPSACLQHAQAVSSRLWPREPLMHSGGALQRLRQRPSATPSASPSATPAARLRHA